MAKFCGNCGSPLDDNGKCPKCDKKQSKKEIKAEKKTEKKKNKSKKVAIIVIVLAAIVFGVGAICLLVYSNKINIPYINDVFISMGLKDEDSKSDTVTENESNKNSDNENLAVTDDDVDLSSNYEVPEFDAEKYFKENTTLKSSFDAGSSQNIHTEDEAYDSFVERGFTDSPITYEYTMDGTYSDACEISEYSSTQHPMYQTYYIASNGDVWMIIEVNGSFFAMPLSYNFVDTTKPQMIISETDTITSYDSTANKFYINVPDKSQTVIKTVTRIDDKTLEKLNSEEIDKL